MIQKAITDITKMAKQLTAILDACSIIEQKQRQLASKEGDTKRAHYLQGNANAFGDVATSIRQLLCGDEILILSSVFDLIQTKNENHCGLQCYQKIAAIVATGATENERWKLFESVRPSGCICHKSDEETGGLYPYTPSECPIHKECHKHMTSIK